MLFMCNVRARANYSFLPLGDWVVYYLLSIGVTVSLVSILSFPFDGRVIKSCTLAQDEKSFI